MLLIINAIWIDLVFGVLRIYHLLKIANIQTNFKYTPYLKTQITLIQENCFNGFN